MRLVINKLLRGILPWQRLMLRNLTDTLPTYRGCGLSGATSASSISMSSDVGSLYGNVYVKALLNGERLS